VILTAFVAITTPAGVPLCRTGKKFTDSMGRAVLVVRSHAMSSDLIFASVKRLAARDVAFGSCKEYDIAMKDEMIINSTRRLPGFCVCLIGAGTVGGAILDDNLSHSVDVILVDKSREAIETACEKACMRTPKLRVQWIEPIVEAFPAARLTRVESSDWIAPAIVIESVPENLELKQSLFSELVKSFGPDVVLASNTSNLRISNVFKPLGDNTRCCGLHFFMPVSARPLVECIPTPHTSEQTKQLCEQYATQIGKSVLHVQDSPGFVVNRLLAPYLNQSLMLLEFGVSAEQLEEAAGRFGMPMSPLRLIDTIGIRTAFDSGRVFWQSFPERLDPSPILPGMIKATRKSGQSSGGFYESEKLSELAGRVIGTYQRATRSWSTDEVAALIAIPMWIEAAEVLASKVVADCPGVELAMRGGLGYAHAEGFFGYFDAMGKETLLQRIHAYGGLFRAMSAKEELMSHLIHADTSTDVIRRYAGDRLGA
jgi:3-hydroxyacyl-CoA dehydrogenase/enoyl-CoA hydratase/3-hydroxybutyryl-CoA epimerase/enoyl-CoA isomerase